MNRQANGPESLAKMIEKMIDKLILDIDILPDDKLLFKDSGKPKHTMHLQRSYFVNAGECKPFSKLTKKERKAISEELLNCALSYLMHWWCFHAAFDSESGLFEDKAKYGFAGFAEDLQQGG